MIPTTTRYSPMKPSTSAQPALPLSTNPTPSTAVHQRSGITMPEWRSLNSRLNKTADLQALSTDPFFRAMIDQDPKAVQNRLFELLGRGELYIHCLEQEGFLTKPGQEQWDIINAFHQKENINPSILAKNEIDTALLMSKSDNEGGLSQAANPDWWRTFVRTVQEEIEKLPALSID